METFNCESKNLDLLKLEKVKVDDDTKEETFWNETRLFQIKKLEPDMQHNEK